MADDDHSEASDVPAVDQPVSVAIPVAASPMLDAAPPPDAIENSVSPWEAALGTPATLADTEPDVGEPAPAPSPVPAAAPETPQARGHSTEVGDVPEEIARRYYVQKSRWSGEPGYHETATSPEPVFRDQGGRIVASNDNPAIARDLVAIAEHRGWQPVQVAGTESFRREIWLAASERGLDVRGYKPNERDLKELARLSEARADRRGNAIAPVEQSDVAHQPATGNRQPVASTNEPVPAKVVNPEPVKPPAPRQYLAVPYKEREAARGAGARWDADAKAWYAGEGASPGALARWQVRYQSDDRAWQLVNSDRNARAQMRVIETVVAKSLGDNPDAAARLLKEARATLASNVEQGRVAPPPLVRDGRARSEQARSAGAQPPVDRSPSSPRRTSPERSRAR